MIRKLANLLLLRTPRMARLGRKFANTFESELSEELLELLLRLMSFVFFLDADFRKNIEHFNARYLFRSRDGSVTVAAIFQNGRMKVHERDMADTNVTVIFRDQNAIKSFLFSPKPDILGSMLRQDVTFNGNLNYLYKFAYMANHLKLMFTGGGGR